MKNAFGKMGFTTRVIRWVLLTNLGFSICCQASIALLQREDETGDAGAIRSLAVLYGQDLAIIVVGPNGLSEANRLRLQDSNTLAVFVSVNSLPRLKRTQLVRLLERKSGSAVPLLVFGISSATPVAELQLWSAGAIVACSQPDLTFRPLNIRVVGPRSLTGAVTGLSLPAVASPICSLHYQKGIADSVLTARGQGSMELATLVRVQDTEAELYFVPEMRPLDVSWLGNPWGLPQAFSCLSPFVFFLSHAVGDYGWHLDGHYANLTIDDAWLRQPFGHLDYVALLAEMEKHKFHTTVAFIPWNFDRSEGRIISLFRDHPDRFSVCIHGNNHSHREFGPYTRNPFNKQVQDVRQGIARMERFRSLTGIPYDRFMVFPQGVAPEATFALLRSYGFLGTANAVNVPLHQSFPRDPTFLLRPFTSSYGDLVSYSRTDVRGGIPDLQIAIRAFLGNPMLFYGHENLFRTGISMFDPVADAVNRIQPDTRWTTLGNIARHSHLLRRRSDGSYDVRMVSTEMELANPTESNLEFHIRVRTDHPVQHPLLTIDTTPASFAAVQDEFTFEVQVPPHAVKRVRLADEIPFDVSTVDIRKRNTYANALRRLSDFRDLYLSTSPLGASIRDNYYRYRLNGLEEHMEGGWSVVVLAFAIVYVGWRYRKNRRAALKQHSIASSGSGEPEPKSYATKILM